MALDHAPDPRTAFEPAEPSLVRPQNRGEVVPPAIEISEASRDQDLPPRPDPAHPNAQPIAVLSDVGSAAAPHQAGRALIVLLRVLVRENGTIADTVLAGSCGVPVLDDLAATFVKAHWKFLPATENGQPVAKWASLEVLVEP